MKVPTTPSLVEVALFIPLHGTLIYTVPPEIEAQVRTGCRVVVPLPGKKVVGMVVQTGVEPGPALPEELKAVLEVLDPRPVLDADLLELVLWCARYYMAPPGEVLRSALPVVLQGKEQRFLHLSAEGRRVLQAQQAVLHHAQDDLNAAELQVLQQMEKQGGVMAARRIEERTGLRRAADRLEQRGLLTRSARRRDPARRRTDLLLELVAKVDPPDLARTPGQARLVELVQQSGGRVRLGTLATRPVLARALAHKLAARGLLRVEVVEIPRDPLAGQGVEVDRPPERLTSEQQAALKQLLEAVRTGRFASFLLFGVTGSGKTEVYLRLIADGLARGKSALVLVPEISLTPQLAARFRARFGNQVAVLHSGLTDAERYGQWQLIKSGQVRIVVGARSAVFAPLTGLGVVVVDEEHDASFKQHEGVRYHGRDLALLRAKRAGAVAVLGSATPSLESFYGTAQGRLGLLRMAHRATPSPLPEVQVVDLRTFRPERESLLSAPLSQCLAETLGKGEQAILFLNRRGFSTFVLCKACGYAFRCPDCSVSLTYHRSRERLICHYCGHAENLIQVCPDCRATGSIGLMGLGTEKLEQALNARFAGARVARLDRDTAPGTGLRSILTRMRRQELDVLVGTQMVTKGHDFPHVTLVGVLCADLGLNFPDFRAAERTFQLLTQVAGRAGRGERPGRVVIQTFSPNHPSVVCAREHCYEAFYAEEVRARRELDYPPCAHLAAVHIDGPDPDQVIDTAEELSRRGRELLRGSLAKVVSLLGPAEAPLQRLKGRTRWMLLVKSPKRDALRAFLLDLLGDGDLQRASGSARVTVDVDPMSMM